MAVAQGLAAGVEGFLNWQQMQGNNRRANEQLQLNKNQDARLQADADRAEAIRQNQIAQGNLAQKWGISNLGEDYDFAKILDEDQDAVTDAEGVSYSRDPDLVTLANNRPDYAYFSGENGEQIKATVQGFAKQPGRLDPKTGKVGEPTYVPIVRRADNGELAPLTQGRTSDPRDNVVAYTRDELNKHLRKRYQTATSMGARQGDQGSLAAYGDLIAQSGNPVATAEAHAIAAVTDKLLDNGATSVLANDPQKLSEFGALINQIDDPKRLKAIYDASEGEGAYDEFVAAEKEAFKDAFYKAQPKSDPNVPGSTAKLLADNGITKEKWDSYSTKQRSDVLATLKKKKGVQVLARDTAGLAMAQMADVVAGNWNDMVDWADEQRASTNGRAILSFLGLQDIDWEKPADRSSTPYEDDVRAAQKEAASDSGRTPGLYTTLDPQLTGDQVQSVLDNQPPKWVADPKAVQQAIINQTADPTQDQVTQINKLLTEKNIDSTPKLQQAVEQDQITPADALTAAWVVAMTTEGDTQKKVNAYQSLVNFVERGATDLTKYQAESLDDAKEKNMIAWDRQNFNWEQLKFRQARSQDRTAKEGLEEADAFQKQAYKIFGLNPEKDPETGELDFEFEPTDEQLTEVARLFPGYRLKLKNAVLANQPVRANTLLQGMNPVLSLYLQGRADENQGWFDSLWTEGIGTGQLGDFDLTRVRIAKKDDDDLPTHIAYLDAGGAGQAGDIVAISDIRKDDKWVADLITQAAVNNAKKIAAGDLPE